MPSTPDLTLTKTHTGNFAQGQQGTYTVAVSNAGTGPTAGTVTVTDTLPTGLTATAMSGTGWTCTLASRACTRSDALNVGASYPPITLTVAVAPNAPASLINQVAVSGGGDTTPANNTATDTTAIGPGADLTLTATHTGNFVQGQPGTYTLTVSNAGGAGASSGTVTATDTLPTGLTATAMSGTGWTCTLASRTCTRSDPLAGGASYPPIALTVAVASNAPASVTNQAAVSGGGDVNGANNTATDSTTVVAPTAGPDLATAIAHSGDFIRGQTGQETVTVSNVGGTATSGPVNVTFAIPTGLTVASVAGSGWTCTTSPASCTRSDALAPGGAYPPVTLTVNVAADAPASVTTSVTVSGGGETGGANSTASDAITLSAPVPVMPGWLLAVLTALLAVIGMASLRRRATR